MGIPQVGFKHMLYMSMHAEAVVDLVEKEHQEVQFRQVQGDFSLLQGKFMLQECSEVPPLTLAAVPYRHWSLMM